jgi:hypothetical protein
MSLVGLGKPLAKDREVINILKPVEEHNQFYSSCLFQMTFELEPNWNLSPSSCSNLSDKELAGGVSKLAVPHINTHTNQLTLSILMVDAQCQGLSYIKPSMNISKERMIIQNLFLFFKIKVFKFIIILIHIMS